MPSILDATERSWKSQQKMEFRFEGIYIVIKIQDYNLLVR